MMYIAQTIPHDAGFSHLEQRLENCAPINDPLYMARTRKMHFWDRDDNAPTHYHYNGLYECGCPHMSPHGREYVLLRFVQMLKSEVIPRLDGARLNILCFGSAGLFGSLALIQELAFNGIENVTLHLVDRKFGTAPVDENGKGIFDSKYEREVCVPRSVDAFKRLSVEHNLRVKSVFYSSLEEVPPEQVNAVYAVDVVGPSSRQSSYYRTLYKPEPFKALVAHLPHNPPALFAKKSDAFGAPEWAISNLDQFPVAAPERSLPRLLATPPPEVKVYSKPLLTAAIDMIVWVMARIGLL